MGVIATSDRQITLFYQARSSIAKQTLAYAKAEGIAIERINILKTPLTGTQIAELADRLGIQVKDLINQKSPAYTKTFEQHELSSDDWITMIIQNPEIMRQPIALRGDRTILVKTPTDITSI